MPGKYEHKVNSALTAFLTEFCRQVYLDAKGIKITPLESIAGLILAPLFGSFGGVIPDKLEPATDPNHRDFCHSITGGTAISFGISKLSADTESIGFNLFNVCLRSTGVGYITHLVDDAGTPKRIPLI